MNEHVAIYLVVDEDNIPRYVGKAACPEKRFKVHQRNKSKSAWAISCLILEYVKVIDWQDRERFWIAYYRQWYALENKTNGGEGLKGETSLETRLKISTALKGKPKSEESKRKLSAAKKGIPVSPTALAKAIEANTGRHPSEETRIKLREWQTGRRRGPNSREHKLKQSLALKGRTKSPEWRRKIGESQIGNKRGPETSAKISIALKGRPAWNKGLRTGKRKQNVGGETYEHAMKQPGDSGGF